MIAFVCIFWYMYKCNKSWNTSLMSNIPNSNRGHKNPLWYLHVKLYLYIEWLYKYKKNIFAFQIHELFLSFFLFFFMLWVGLGWKNNMYIAYAIQSVVSLQYSQLTWKFGTQNWPHAEVHFFYANMKHVFKSWLWNKK